MLIRENDNVKIILKDEIFTTFTLMAYKLHLDNWEFGAIPSTKFIYRVVSL